MKTWRVNFFDKNGTETRSLTVEADTEEEAEDKACDKAAELEWPLSFRVCDAEEID